MVNVNIPRMSILDDNETSTKNIWSSEKVNALINALSINITDQIFGLQQDLIQNFNSCTKKHCETILGDGTTTTFTITHNLGTKDVVVQVRILDTDKYLLPDQRVIDDNTVEIGFGVAPAVSKEHRVVVIG